MKYLDIIDKEIEYLERKAETRRSVSREEVRDMADLLYICRHFCGDGNAESATAKAVSHNPVSHNPY